MTRIHAEGRLELPLPAAEALWLFTPEGERAWVEGWDPTYPAGEPGESSGTVFVTEGHEAATTWVVIEIDRREHAAAYARVTPGHHSGLVRVRCEDLRPGYCRVIVEYDLTALAGSSESVLDPYRPAPFAEMIESWTAAITRYLSA